MKLRGSPAFEDPLYHLSAYGILNPVVAECIERGVYNDHRCLGCLGAGGSGRWFDSPERGSVEIPCRECGGSGHRRVRPHRMDAGDLTSQMLAARLGIETEPHEWGCRALRDWRRACDCRPR